jgi:CRP/FNR family transcriptional regulator
MKKELEPSSCIQKVPIFKNLSNEELDEIIMISSHKKLEKGAFIFNQGDTLNSLYVVHKGKIKITRYSEDGKEQVIRILGHGEFLGELALFNQEITTTHAEALEDAIVCLVDNKRLKDLMSKSPNLALKMMHELSNRLEKAESMIEGNLYPAKQRLVKLLLTLEKDQIIRFQTTKANLASQIGITPETFSRKLKELEQDEYIELINNKTIKILDKKALKQVINSNQI